MRGKLTNCRTCCQDCTLAGTESMPKSCVSYKPQITNADRIRSMTDDELAVFLCDINGCYFSLLCPGDKLCTKGDGKANGLKKWLKQPCEDSLVEKG